MVFRKKPVIPEGRRGLTFQELLKRKREMKTSVVLPKKRFLPARGGGLRLAFSRLSSRVKRFFFLFIFTAFTILLIYIIFFSSVLKVTRIRYFHGREEVKNPPFSLPLEELHKKHFFLIAPSDLARKIIQEKGNEIASFRIHRRIPHTLLIRYETFPEVANVVITKDGLKRNFIVNERGFVVSLDAEDSRLPFIQGSFEDFPKRGVSLLSEHHAKAIARAHKIFEEKFGMEVPLILYKKIEREAHLKTERGFTIWLDLTQDVERQLFKLKRSLSKLDIYNENLAYIDLRISGKTGEKVIFKKR